MTADSARGVRRVCILRPDHLGDAILFSGALRHIRARFPSAEILYVGLECTRDLVAPCPHVDRFISWEALTRRVSDGLPRLRGRGILDRAALAHRARRWCRSDIVMLPVRSPTAEMHRALAAIPARTKVGIGGDYANQTPRRCAEAARHYTSRLELPASRQWDHELTVTRDFLELLGITVELQEVAPEPWITAESRRWAAVAIDPLPGVALLVIAPGVASLPQKVYPAVQLGSAIAMLSAPVRVVIVGTPAEREACCALDAALRETPNVVHVQNLGGCTTVAQLGAVLERAAVVLSQETAALHLATALGRPTVGIMGGGHWGRFYPWGDPARHRAANASMACYRCGWNCRFDSIRCIQEIPPERIAAEIAAVLPAGAHAATA